MADDDRARLRMEKSLCMKVADRFGYGAAGSLDPVVLSVDRFDRESEVEVPFLALRQFGEADIAGNYRYALVMVGADGVKCRGRPVSREAIAAAVPEIVADLTENKNYKTVQVAIPDYFLKTGRAA